MYFMPPYLIDEEEIGYLVANTLKVIEQLS